MRRGVSLLAAMAMLVAVLVIPGMAQSMDRNDGGVPNLRPFLSAELHEIDMLQAQALHLDSRGNTEGAALIRSLIPDHQMQVTRLRQIMDMYGQSTNVSPPEITMRHDDFRGFVTADRRAHAKIVSDYKKLHSQAANPDVRMLAMHGLDGANRHFQILVAIENAQSGHDWEDGKTAFAVMSLHADAAAGLNTQAAALDQMGDQQLASSLRTIAAQHEARANVWRGLAIEYDRDVSELSITPVMPLPSRQAILDQAKIINTQLASMNRVLMSTDLDPEMQAQVVPDQTFALSTLDLVNSATG